MTKVVLAYSGGLDTSVAVKWLKEKYGCEVVTLTVDVGAVKDLDVIRARALATGAEQAFVVDARDTFISEYVWPALQAHALYEGSYPLATALARPLIASLLVDVAHQVGANAVAHGCTGKGNDQVRFDVATTALDPSLAVIAPVREWGMSRDQEMAYAAEHGIQVPTTKQSPYSVDENLWGRSVEAGILEDPWVEPPADAYQWTTAPEHAPQSPQHLEIGFESGIPVSLDGKPLGGAALVEALNKIGGTYGIGRIDRVESRLVGIKSREIYEAPAAVLLHAAHSALEDLAIGRDVAKFKSMVSSEYADLIYNGAWFSPLRYHLQAFVASTQKFVTGTIRLKLTAGTIQISGRQSPYSLYNPGLATYGDDDTFSHDAAIGFIKLWGLPIRTAATVQGIPHVHHADGLRSGDTAPVTSAAE
ncbi:MAG: argininosuccinate synthase [Chloroflexi bacterium]|nr:argininosuccinate synthase [Chloroflexota bacterium]